MICPICRFENLPESTFCTKCGHRFSQRAVLFHDHARPYHPPRRPWVAAAVSLVIPGLGHGYAGRWKMAVGWHLGVVALAAVTLWFFGHPLTWLLGVSSIGLGIFVAADAYLVVCRQEGRAVSLSQLQQLYVSLVLACLVLFGAPALVAMQSLASVAIERVLAWPWWLDAPALLRSYRQVYLIPREGFALGDQILIAKQTDRSTVPQVGQIVAHNSQLRLPQETDELPQVMVIRGGIGEVVSASATEVTIRSYLALADGSRRELVQTVPTDELIGTAIMIYYPPERRRFLGG